MGWWWCWVSSRSGWLLELLTELKRLGVVVGYLGDFLFDMSDIAHLGDRTDRTDMIDPLKPDFPGHLCRAAFTIPVMFQTFL